jgi:predicted GIY-YIG superfamily endonuclease
MLPFFRAMPRDYNFGVYIVTNLATNPNHSVLYIGVTNRLSRRTWEHREGPAPFSLPNINAKKQPLHSRLRFAPLEMTECAFGIENECCVCQNRRKKQS